MGVGGGERWQLVLRGGDWGWLEVGVGGGER